MEDSGHVYMLALDASKAFDRVDFCKLFDILLARKCDPLYVRMLINMYVKQTMRVNFNGIYSNHFGVTNGVKQGGVLSPVLFSCYIDKLLRMLSVQNFGCKVGDYYTGCIGYADNVVLLAPTISALKGQIEIAEQVAIEHNIKFNGNKSQLICIGDNSHDYSRNINITLGGEQIKICNSVVYLGHHILSDRNDSLTEHIRHDFTCKLNIVMADFSDISSHVKHSLVEKYCLSLYGINFCDFANVSKMDSIFKVWRKSVRLIILGFATPGT